MSGGRLRSHVGAEQLALVIARCQADLQSPVEFEGSGAPVTLRRALAVSGTRDGRSLDEIVANTGLAPERIAAVAANVERDGLAALQPSYPERVPRRLTAEQRAAICRLSNGAPSPVTHRSGVLDRAVHAGIVPDLSTRTLVRAYRLRSHPWRRDRRRVPAASLRAEVLFGVGMLLVGAVFSVLVVADRTSGAGRYFVLLVPGIFLAIGGALLWSGAHGVALQRLVRQRDQLQDTADAFESIEPTRLSRFPLRFDVHNVLAMPDPAGDSTGPDGDVRYLWIFDASSDQHVLFRDGWPDIAPTRLLTNAQLLTPAHRRRARRARGTEIVSDAAGLDRRMARLPTEFGRHHRPPLAIGWMARKHDGHPVTALLCTDEMWTSAFDRLHERAGIVVVNLAGFTADHPGLAHEIRHVLRPPSPTPEVFLVDSETDADAAINYVADIWRQVEAVDPLIFVRVPFTDQQAASGSDFAARFRHARRGIGPAESAPVARRIWKSVAR